ncbi:symbiotic chitinase [Penicillium pulvis]|uniref:symbiotic chitinase n=1 Tax=Penicillium pulvis TaxID=1562058 RepID=UPI00254699EC|nr:symbiotic chitinase [Penicillium pulvis]KAJ5813995.1 symbiotic chitinase [Penicillium pulvis]
MIETAIGVYAYLANDEVKLRMQRIIYHVRQQLALTDAALKDEYPGEKFGLALAWDEYLLDLLNHIQNKSTLFIETWLTRIAAMAVAKEDKDNANLIKSICTALRAQADRIIMLGETEHVNGYTGVADGDSDDMEIDDDDDAMEID